MPPGLSKCLVLTPNLLMPREGTRWAGKAAEAPGMVWAGRWHSAPKDEWWGSADPPLEQH